MTGPIGQRYGSWRIWAHTEAGSRVQKSGQWPDVCQYSRKYLKTGTQESLFDLASGARERADRKDAHPELFERLKAQFAAWNAGMLPYGSDE